MLRKKHTDFIQNQINKWTTIKKISFHGSFFYIILHNYKFNSKYPTLTWGSFVKFYLERTNLKRPIKEAQLLSITNNMIKTWVKRPFDIFLYQLQNLGFQNNILNQSNTSWWDGNGSYAYSQATTTNVHGYITSHWCSHEQDDVKL